MSNDGALKEKEMIYSLNNKKVKELSNNARELLRRLFGKLDDELMVRCYKVDEAFKTDFVISYNGQQKNVSMKSETAVVVHNEILLNFIDFLRGLGISEETLDTIKLFHYGDGTTDGTGQIRLPYDEVAQQLKDRIKKANMELNASMDVILAVMNRCVFKGSHEDNIEADCLYFGDADYGVVANKKQFIRNIQKRGFDFYSHLHCGKIFFRPDARYLNKDINEPRKVDRIVCYWPHLKQDIEYMSKKLNY